MSAATKIANIAKHPMTFGFIGLGQMGYPMAKNLRLKLPDTDKLIVLDINQDVMGQLVQETKEASVKEGKPDNARQVDLAQSAREVAEKASVILTCLPTVQIVKDTYSSIMDKGALAPLEQQRLFIECSTIDPGSSTQLASSVQERLGSHFIDAPISGGAVGAQAGTLSFMFGSSDQSEEFIENANSIFHMMGTKVWHMGGPGCGVSAKLANNYILAINNIAAAEALNMGRQWGLDMKNLTELISSSTGHCWPVEVNNPVPGVVKSSPASNDYKPGCSISMINKDLGLAMTGAEQSGIPLLLASTARDAYSMIDQEYRGRDFSIVYEWLRTHQKDN